MIKRLLEKLSGAGLPVVTASLNSSVQRGCWGENIAAAHLQRIGWRIVGRNVRPCKQDRRCELDIVAYVPAERQVVFVEVKTHWRHSPYASRLWAIDRRKRDNLLRATANWLMARKWHGNCRFDVIEVYGEEGGDMPPEIDHIMNVKLFPPNWRFW
jgi:putative endonuclease